MAIPIGDILRSFVNPNSWFGKILRAIKGTKITTSGGTEILLDKGNQVYPSTGSPLDNTPHKHGPVAFNPRPR